MLDFEAEVPVADDHYDMMIEEIESIDPDMLNFVVPGSQLHERINSTISMNIEKD